MHPLHTPSCNAPFCTMTLLHPDPLRAPSPCTPLHTLSAHPVQCNDLFALRSSACTLYVHPLHAPLRTPLCAMTFLHSDPLRTPPCTPSTHLESDWLRVPTTANQITGIEKPHLHKIQIFPPPPLKKPSMQPE